MIKYARRMGYIIKKFKKFLALALVACMAMSMSIGAVGEVENEAGNKEPEPRYIVSCPGGDKHNMEGKGYGRAYYGSAPSSDVRIDGTAFQCTLCNLVLITENNPLQVGVTWGNYATCSYNEPLPSNIIMYTDSFGYSNSNSDPYVQGFNFGRGRMYTQTTTR